MGMKKMFEFSEDFDGLLETCESMSVSKVIHKAFIEVDEEGAEAAAATGNLIRILSLLENRINLFPVIMMVGCTAFMTPPKPEKFFIANHPFVFSLMMKDQVLFMGRLKSF